MEGSSQRTAVDLVVRRMVGVYAPEPVELAEPEDDILDLGFTSLRLLELAFTLEDLFGLDPAAMGEAPPVGTVEELCDFLWEKVSGGEASLPPPELVDAAAAGT